MAIYKELTERLGVYRSKYVEMSNLPTYINCYYKEKKDARIINLLTNVPDDINSDLCSQLDVCTRCRIEGRHHGINICKAIIVFNKIKQPCKQDGCGEHASGDMLPIRDVRLCNYCFLTTYVKPTSVVDSVSRSLKQVRFSWSKYLQAKKGDLSKTINKRIKKMKI